MAKATKGASASTHYPDDWALVLLDNPHIQSVWINKNGDWWTSKKPGTKEVTREEVLDTTEQQ